MALINCPECNREISDKAPSCPGCGAPTTSASNTNTPTKASYNQSDDSFTGSIPLIAKLAMKAVQDLGWTVDQVNDSVGLVTFQTKMSWGSWSGVTGTLSIEEVGENRFRVTGSGKQNVRGGQLVALNIGNEAQKKANKVIDRMKQLAS